LTSPSSSPASAFTAHAGTNIALVKYWGKRDARLNLPAAGSLSLTLKELGTRTTVRFDPSLGPEDRVRMNGREADARTHDRVVRFLDLVRARAHLATRADVVTENSVPTAAGLASSASGFAALALAASRAAGLELGPAQLSELARRGSGSAARSIFGGFVEMQAGVRVDGSDAVAAPLVDGRESADEWPIRLVVAVTADAEKSIGSTEAMERTERTSPFYAAWVDSVPRDLVDARAAIVDRDLERLGRMAERNAVRMHASAMAADPPILYWNAVTWAAMQTVRDLRAGGVGAYFTIDAGPHVKVVCLADDVPVITRALGETPGVLRTLVTSPGPGARVLQEASS
jgi:diphosphomevalonate decarboxylase